MANAAWALGGFGALALALSLLAYGAFGSWQLAKAERDDALGFRTRIDRLGDRLTSVGPAQVVSSGAERVVPLDPNELFRNEPLLAGTTVALTDVRATAMEADENGVARVRFVFNEPVDDPSHAWIVEDARGVRYAPPPRGEYDEPLDP